MKRGIPWSAPNLFSHPPVERFESLERFELVAGSFNSDSPIQA